MRKLFTFLCFIPLALSALEFANYDNSTGYDSGYQCCEETNSSYLSVGFGYSRLKFQPGSTPSFTGDMFGAQAKYEYKPVNCLYEAVKFNWRQGDIHAGDGVNRKLTDFNTQGRIGYTFSPTCTNFAITGFTGFGWRYLGHKLTQPALQSMRFNFNEVYIPLGILVDLALNDCLYIGLTTTWMPQVFSTVNIIPIGDIRYILSKTTSNFLVELPITYNFCECGLNWFFQFTPTFEYWQDGAPTASTESGLSLGLPKNDYTFWGFELNLGCAF